MATVFVCEDIPAPSVPADCLVWVADEYEPHPFSLSAADANALGASILALWALAWVFRQIARLLSNL